MTSPPKKIAKPSQIRPRMALRCVDASERLRPHFVAWGPGRHKKGTGGATKELELLSVNKVDCRILFTVQWVFNLETCC